MTVILKALGLLGDWEVDKLHNMKELVGSYCSGDWRRKLMIDATGMNAANFTTFSTGIGTHGFVTVNKFFDDFPKEMYKLQGMGLFQQLPRHKSEEELEKPAYLTDVKFAMTTGIIIDSMCPKTAQNPVLARCPEYKYTMYHHAHDADRTLEVVTREWDNYQKKWKEEGYDHDYVPYPYTKQIISEWCEDWTKLMGLPISVDGPGR